MDFKINYKQDLVNEWLDNLNYKMIKISILNGFAKSRKLGISYWFIERVLIYSYTFNTDLNKPETHCLFSILIKVASLDYIYTNKAINKKSKRFPSLKRTKLKRCIKKYNQNNYFVI